MLSHLPMRTEEHPIPAALAQPPAPNSSPRLPPFPGATEGTVVGGPHGLKLEALSTAGLRLQAPCVPTSRNRKLVTVFLLPPGCRHHSDRLVWFGERGGPSFRCSISDFGTHPPPVSASASRL